MNSHKFTAFHVKRYRSLLDVKIDISEDNTVIICGENNIGKTNFLRALNVFFNHPNQEDIYDPKKDIPHHIFYGSKGAGSNTELVGTFEINGKKIILKVIFDNNGLASYFFDKQPTDAEKVKDFLSDFQFLYVESSNIDLPKFISVILEKDGLLPLDKKRSKQSEPLEKLAEFISLSERAIQDIEDKINDCFSQLTDFDGILKGKKIHINFAEFEKLRDVVKTMTSITLDDGNNHGIASKGSGAQRAVFLSLMQFISQNSKKKVIWGVDEPETFLQPKLQKKVFEVFQKIGFEKKQPVIITTHSQHFVKLNNLSSTYVFKGELSPKEYQRKPGQVFFEMKTESIICSSDYEKASLIKKHLGISNNDGWEVLPYNLLVEGEEDKKYLEIMFSILNLPTPNIAWSGGASKIAGYLQYYDIFAKDLDYRPSFVCIFDNDEEGRTQAAKIKNRYSFIDVKVEKLPRYDGKVSIEKSVNEDWEIEDFISPEIMLETINQILKKEQYKPITKAQIKNKEAKANNGKQVLKYAEECTTQNNPDKSPFKIDNEGRKKQICLKFCERAYSLNLPSILLDSQKEFLKKIAKC